MTRTEDIWVTLDSAEIGNGLDPVDTRHPDITNDDIDHQRIVATVQDLNRPPAVLRLLDVVPRLSQRHA